MRLATIVSNQSRAILVIVALLCAAGIYAAWQLPVAILPRTGFPRIVIIVDNGEAPASQTLVSVTRPTFTAQIKQNQFTEIARPLARQ